MANVPENSKPDHAINYALAAIGHPKHIAKMLAPHPIEKGQVVGYRSKRAMEHVAWYGTNEDRKKLVNHPNFYVRSICAHFGDDGVRDMMLNDHHPNVQIILVKERNDKHRSFFLKSKDLDILAAIIHRGNPSHWKELSKHSDPCISKLARSKLIAHNSKTFSQKSK